MKTQQLDLGDILEQSFKAREAKLFTYAYRNVSKYRVAARMITPDLSSKEQVFDRIAFAILSANAPFEKSVAALDYVSRNRGMVDAEDLIQYTMVPTKAAWLNSLWDIFDNEGHGEYLKGAETWQDYRLLLAKKVKGLALAKASFAASLLYPLEADLACIDTWMQKHYLGHSGFKTLSQRDYLKVEARIRRFAGQVGVNTFLGQWMIWDAVRGEGMNDHAVFPGTHKD